MLSISHWSAQLQARLPPGTQHAWEARPRRPRSGLQIPNIGLALAHNSEPADRRSISLSQRCQPTTNDYKHSMDGSGAIRRKPLAGPEHTDVGGRGCHKAPGPRLSCSGNAQSLRTGWAEEQEMKMKQTQAQVSGGGTGQVVPFSWMNDDCQGKKTAILLSFFKKILLI